MTTRTKVLFALLGLAFGVVVVGAVLIAPSGTGVALPEQVERISPTNGAIVLRQTVLEIDMVSGYEIELWIDGVQIPESEMDIIEGTSFYRWTPSETTIIPEWTPGEHEILITWDTRSGFPDPGSLRWRFTAQ